MTAPQRPLQAPSLLRVAVLICALIVLAVAAFVGAAHLLNRRPGPASTAQIVDRGPRETAAGATATVAAQDQFAANGAAPAASELLLEALRATGAVALQPASMRAKATAISEAVRAIGTVAPPPAAPVAARPSSAVASAADVRPPPPATQIPNRIVLPTAPVPNANANRISVPATPPPR